MPKGFDSADDIKVQIALKRLTPAALRHDANAFADGLWEVNQRYGSKVLAKALAQLGGENPWVTSQAIGYLPEDKQRLIEAVAFGHVAGTLEAAGLRLEDHLRVSDQGFAVTTAAVKVIAKTGYPGIAELGKGQPSLDGIGINRKPFIHHLSEIDHANERMNFWAAVSMLVSAAQGWGSEPPNDVAFQNLQKMVSRANPTADLGELLKQSRYDDRALLKLASLAYRGMETLGGSFDMDN